MFCPNCGMKLSENATSCANCKQVVAQELNETIVQQPIQQPAQLQNMTNEFVAAQQPIQNSKKSISLKFLGIILAVIVLGIIGYFVIDLSSKEYTITFKSDNFTTIETQKVKKNENVKKPVDPILENHYFDGWYADKDKDSREKYDFDKPVTKDLELIALFIPNSEKQNNTDNSNVTPSSDAFLFAVEDVFTITGRGTVVTGHVERGSIKVGDEVEIIGLGEKKKAIVSSIEMFREMKDVAETGDNAGLLLKDIGRDDVQRGQVLAKPNSIGLHTQFKANVYILTKEEGGRHTPFFENYKPQFYFRTTDVTGSIKLPSGVEMVMPGDKMDLTIELILSIALEVGTEFSIREGGRTVGKGTVLEIIK